MAYKFKKLGIADKGWRGTRRLIQGFFLEEDLAEVDAKIRERIKAGVFPVRLKAEEWDCGDIAWLLDVVAPTKKQATSVLANFHQVVKDGKLFIHPAVRGLVEGDVLSAEK